MFLYIITHLNKVCECISGWGGSDCSVNLQSARQTGLAWLDSGISSNLFSWYREPSPPKERRVSVPDVSIVSNETQTNEAVKGFKEEEKGLGIGALIGIAVGAVVAILILILGTILCYRQFKSGE